MVQKDANESKVEIAENEVTNVIQTAPADTTEYYLEVIYSRAEAPSAASNTNTTTSDGIAHFVGNEKAHNKIIMRIYMALIKSMSSAVRFRL